MTEAPVKARRLSPHQRWGIFVASATALLLLYPLRFALIPFVVSSGIAFVLSPAVDWLTNRVGGRRWAAGAIIFVAILAALGGLAWWIKAIVAPDAIELTQSLPEMTRKLFVSVAGGDHLRLFGNDFTADTFIAQATTAAKSLMGGDGGFASLLVNGMSAILLSVLTLSTLCYFLISGPQLYRGAIWLFPPALRPHARGIAIAMKPFLYRYVVGLIAVIAATCVLSWIGLAPVLHMPHATVLALLVGLLEIFPVVGAVLSGMLLGLAAIAQGSLTTVIAIALFTLILRLLIDQVIGPIIYGKASELHPTAVLLAFLIGGTFYGMVGLLLAVPAAATLRIALRRTYNPSDLRRVRRKRRASRAQVFDRASL